MTTSSERLPLNNQERAVLSKIETYLWVAIHCKTWPFFSVFLDNASTTPQKDAEIIQGKIRTILTEKDNYEQTETNYLIQRNEGIQGDPMDIVVNRIAGLEAGKALTEDDVQILQGIIQNLDTLAA